MSATETTSDTDDLYQTLIMERARTPHHAGTLDPSDADAEGDNPMCGDRIHLHLRHTNGTIAALRHETRGCAICIAAADLMGDAVIGQTPTTTQSLADAFERLITTGNADHDGLAGLRALSGVHDYRSRHRCALLPWQALRTALGTLTETTHG